ncbi:MAG TPA: YbaK/EbsC family protein [Balneolales bacterium]|nr:YbaK/EbsC family protein [Balneolales bacterium]
MPIRKLKRFLDEENVNYEAISHSKTETAHQTAHAVKMSDKDIAKTVMVKVDGKMAMIVLPASHKIHFNMLERELGAKNIELATEEEFKEYFPECEIGAMPPFGNLYNLDVIVSYALKDDEMIAFNAGTHEEAIRMSYKDFERLVEPRIARFTLSSFDY